MTDTSETENKAQIPELPLVTKKISRHITIAELFGKTDRVLDNMNNNIIISEKMEKFGFVKSKMEHLRQLLSAAKESDSAQIREFGEKLEANSDFDKLYDIANKDFSTIRKIARVVLKHDKVKMASILVDDRKKMNYAGVFKQMQNCYDNILLDQEILDKLAIMCVTADMVKGYMQNLDSAKDAYSVFVRENSEAVYATSIRDEKIEALKDFLSDFSAMAKIAFADHPELLSQIS